MNIVLYKDLNTEMLAIEVDQETVFYGNFWDFKAPSDLQSLLEAISKADRGRNIKVTQLFATMDD